MSARLFVLFSLVAFGIAQAPLAWKEAAPGRPIALPADHASHPEYKLEWWYYTGNLDAADGRRFGYQVTFFRVGVDPSPANPSRWAVRDLFMTHVALTDVNGKRFQFTDRINRAGPGWAGAAVDRYRVWNEDWQALLESPGHHHVQAASDAFGIDLRLDETRPAALHGDHGFSRKGAVAGNASYYYSLTRMPTRGTITLDGKPIPVTGLSWMDHEFGTSFLEPDQIGWDWFSMQLDDGRDLMLFQLRRRDGSIDPQSSGTLVETTGATRTLDRSGGFTLQPGRRWRSPQSGATYPVTWQVHIPATGLDVTTAASVDAQELRTDGSTGVTYWEGAIDINGTSNGKPVRGRGYLEMTGYTGQSMGNLLR
jgi:predicted secreted hydrolase